jgi:hypothetical protein
MLRNRLARFPPPGRACKQPDLYAPDSPVQVDVRDYRMFPQALDEFRDFYGLHGKPTAPRRSLRIRYLHDVGADGWLTLEVSP